MDFNKELSKININIDDKMSLRFEKYYKKLVEVNEYMNLTAITERNDVYLKHFYDSLTLVKALPYNVKTLCDVGGGAGFPSMPLAIAKEDINITVIDALNKRINFLNDVTKELELTNIKALHERAEDYQKKNRETFDAVTARAVARLNVLAELCMPLVKIGGVFVAMKASDTNEEIKEASKGIEILGGRIKDVISFELPDDAGKRELVVIEKIKPTPAKYPRSFGKIKERPL